MPKKVADMSSELTRDPAAGRVAATLSGGLVTNWTGKRLFAAAPTQTNPPVAGEYYPAQAIYATPTLTYDDSGALWVFFGTGDRNHPNNASSNRFYGIKDNTSMTNGDVASASEEGGAKSITVTYNGGKQTILVPPTAPIVTFQPAEHSAAMIGAHVFIKASVDGSEATADQVAVGKDGLTPPM